MEEMTQKDHDLLIQVDTKLDIIISRFDSVERNANEVPTLKDEINRLRAKTNLQDMILAFATAIGILLSNLLIK